MTGTVASGWDSAEQALLCERRAVGAWLLDLEKRVEGDERLYERLLQVRRILGKLDGRIRVVRDLERLRRGRSSRV